ncbi:hypothetical protein CH373_16225 [Leptospira perolatii]|uniref:Response regulatory domain-containing protein n=1 Tax=Leptospira perolatii TaxID=2023191 RepID=A0A2M9ZIW6_9LEPT|nr:response regulator [Leptospira perolatii]PJZ69492.1 hypothetical protein CH360_10825 [Leptospira perolatii]PJZ72007.1 hypothetical protein CH373_16225 [Leptospira perolatii]
MKAQVARILIVEDESIVAKDLRTRLIDLGYSVPAIAYTGEDAVQKAIEYEPDLVLLDIMLSRSTLDGIEVASAIRSRIDTAIIYLSAYADTRTFSRTRETEPFCYLLKPVRTKELSIALEMALNKKEKEESQKRNRELLKFALESLQERSNKTEAERLGLGIVSW